MSPGYCHTRDEETRVQENEAQGPPQPEGQVGVTSLAPGRHSLNRLSSSRWRDKTPQNTPWRGRLPPSVSGTLNLTPELTGSARPASGETRNTRQVALAPPLLPEEEAGPLSASSLSTGSRGWLLPQAPLGFTHLLTDSLGLQPPRATFTRANKGLKSSQRCHLDHLDQRWTTQRPTVPGTCKSKPSRVADTGHVWLLSTGMWPVALRSQNTHFSSI